MEGKKSKKKVGIIVTIIVALLLMTILTVTGIFVLPKLLNRNNQEGTAKTEPKEQIILYDGYEMKPTVGIQYLSDMQKSEEANSKYNTTYHNYESGEYKGTTQGSFGEETYEGYSIVQNVKKIAMTQEYNAIPRSAMKTNILPIPLKDLKQCSNFNVHTIDLDGDNNMETLISYDMGKKEEEGKTIYQSAITLYNSQYYKVATLVKMEGSSKTTAITLDNVEYFDIDNDGTMEIIVDVPTYEGVKISIVKYSNGVFEGEKDIKANPEEENKEENEQGIETIESADTINGDQISEKLKFLLSDVTYANAIQDEEIYKNGNVDTEDFYKAVKLNVAFNCVEYPEEENEDQNQLAGKDKTAIHKAMKEAFGEDVKDIIKSEASLLEYNSSRDQYVFKDAGDATLSVFIVKVEEQKITDDKLKITYLYAYPEEGDALENNIGHYDCYRITLNLKINKDYEYSKYQLLDKFPLKRELAGKIKDIK